MPISQEQRFESIACDASENGLGQANGEQFEAELVEQACSDPEAFGRLYERYYDTIRNYIYRRTLNIATAEDLTSNTFFKALRGLPRYRYHAPFCAWLYRIATNEVRMHRRSAWFRRVKGIEEAGMVAIDRIYFAAPEAEGRVENEERMRQYAVLHEVLKQLPEPYQTVLILRYFEGLKHEEIAQVLGKRLGTVKSLASRGLKRMARLMKEKNATIS